MIITILKIVLKTGLVLVNVQLPIISVIYGDISSEPALKLSVFSNSFLTSETDTTIDMLHERDVETQTKIINYVEETSRLKQRHQREMRRLNRQRKGIKRCLANQCMSS